MLNIGADNRSTPNGKHISLKKKKLHDFITTFCHVSFTILSEHYGQTNFPIIKTKSIKVT